MHSFEWNGRNDSNQHLPSGSYIVVVRSGINAEFLKLSLIK